MDTKTERGLRKNMIGKQIYIHKSLEEEDAKQKTGENYYHKEYQKLIPEESDDKFK